MSVFQDAVTPSILQRRIVRAEGVWPQARATQDLELVPRTPTLSGLLTQQTARMPALDDRSRRPVMDIAWLEACAGSANLKTGVWPRGIECDFSGWIVGSNKQTIKIDDEVNTTFEIEVEDFDNLFTIEEKFNRAYAKAVKLLLERMNAQAIAKLVLWAGQNIYRSGIGQPAGPTGVATEWLKTKVPYGNTYAQSLGNYLSQVEARNSLNAPRLYQGGVIATQDPVAATADSFPFAGRTTYNDPFGFGAQGLDDQMFLVSNGAFACFSTFNFPRTPEVRQGTNFNEIVMSRPIPGYADANGNPLVVDIQHRRTQVTIGATDHTGWDTTGKCTYVDKYFLKIAYKFHLNPLACADGTTGIVHLVADRTLTPVFAPGAAVLTREIPA